MEHLRELLAVDGRQTLAFFVLGLQDVCEPAKISYRREYVGAA